MMCVCIRKNAGGSCIPREYRHSPAGHQKGRRRGPLAYGPRGYPAVWARFCAGRGTLSHRTGVLSGSIAGSIRERRLQLRLRHTGEEIVASSADAAMGLARSRPAPIDVLLCDVILPGMSGPDLAEQFLLAHPETRCLFMAGLPGTREITEKILNRGLPFLAKPFLPATLVNKVREVLGHASAPDFKARTASGI